MAGPRLPRSPGDPSRRRRRVSPEPCGLWTSGRRAWRRTRLPPSFSGSSSVPCQPPQNRALWFCDGGRELEARPSAEAAAPLHFSLVPAGRGTYVNRRRLRAIRAEHKQFRLVLDEGTELTMSWGGAGEFVGGAWIARFVSSSAFSRAAFSGGAAGLAGRAGDDAGGEVAGRVWPGRGAAADCQFAVADGAVSSAGSGPGLWYRAPRLLVCARGGHAGAGGDVGVRRCGGGDGGYPRGPAEALYALFLEVVGRLVGDDALFTFTELDFRDPRPDLRRIGTTRPEVVLIAEKTSLEKGVQLIADRFGVSTIILGGLPSLLSSEFFSRELRRVLTGPVRLVAYVDFDPGGWVAAQSFGKQLARFGVPSERLDFLVRPERFSQEEELDLYSIALPAPTPEVAGKVKAWVALSGGIHGQARGLHADHLRPPERAAAAFGEILSGDAGTS